MPVVNIFFFFNDTATTEIYTLSLHDALPICRLCEKWHLFRGTPSRYWLESVLAEVFDVAVRPSAQTADAVYDQIDRKSTRLNSSHANISYSVFCFKKKKNTLSPPSMSIPLSL